MLRAVPWLLAVMLLAATAAPAVAGTVEKVRARGHVQCGVNPDLPGFSQSADGAWSGFDVDICRAIAAAVFGDPAKARFTPLTPDRQIEALRSGEVDVLSSNATWTMRADTMQGVRFAAVTYYDGQGFITNRKLGVASVLELSGARICTLKGSLAEENIAEFFQIRKMPFQPVALERPEEMLKAYDSGRCDAFTGDLSSLHSIRFKLASPAEHIVLPEIASKEPMGPLVRQHEERWFDIVRWTVFAMINAEELGVTSGNVDSMLQSTTPAIRRLLGLDGDLGGRIGLEQDWAQRIIRDVGNYGEVFSRNVGEGSALKIPRGVNALWNQGGILYAPPIR